MCTLIGKRRRKKSIEKFKIIKLKKVPNKQSNISIELKTISTERKAQKKLNLFFGTMSMTKNKVN